MKKHFVRILFFAGIISFSNVIVAETSSKTLIKEYSIPLELAVLAASTALDTCLNKGFNTTVTVLDQRGQMKVQLVSEGAFPHSVQTSFRKAFTAASRRVPTSELAEHTSTEPSLGQLFHEIGMATLSGGLPIKYGDEIIGAIGIAGAPGEDDAGNPYDDQCAAAGIARIQNRVNDG
ncbi:MAG: heme-binding protein [Pseudomonadota bacterium]